MKLSSFRFGFSTLVAGLSLLSVFSSTAHAGHWQGYSADKPDIPLYTVTSRSPANPENTIPEGNSSGYVIPVTNDPESTIGTAGGTGSGGTATAEFQWIPDTGKTIITDPPPASVYVLEYGYAEWSAQSKRVITPGGPRGRSSNPSVSDAMYQRGQKGRNSGPRLFLVQTQTRSGTANNGLGVAPDYTGPYTPTTNGGKSESYAVSAVTPDATGKISVTRSLLATVTAYVKDDITGASWKYRARILDIKIKRNGVDVTAPKPAKDVMVGEINSMNVEISGAAGLTLPPITYLWDIPGDRVKDFVTTAANTTFTGHAVQLTTTDLQSSSPSFYWYNGTFAGDSKEVSVVVTISGKPITVKAEFKVYRPSFDGLTVTYQKQKPPHEAEPMVDFDKINSISFGPLSPGVKFVGVATVPNIPAAAGQIALQQLATSTPTSGVKVKNEVAIPHTYEHLVDTIGVDVGDNEQQIFTMPNNAQNAPPTDTRKPINPGTDGGTAFTEGDDTPNVPSDPWTKIIAKFDFTMYLMYKPTSTVGSIWVPLGKNSWGGGFDADDATHTKNWVFTDRYPTVAQAIGNGGVDTHDLPEWDSSPRNAHYEPIAAW